RLAEFAQYGELLQRAEAVAARFLGQGRREDAGLGQRLPQRLVEAAGGVQLAQPVGGHQLGAHLGGEGGEIELALGGGEVHGVLAFRGSGTGRDQRAEAGWRRAVMAMMSRCTSLVPPPKVRINAARCRRSSLPRSCVPAESWRR